jgi:hypothetical protein
MSQEDHKFKAYLSKESFDLGNFIQGALTSSLQKAFSLASFSQPNQFAVTPRHRTQFPTRRTTPKPWQKANLDKDPSSSIFSIADDILDELYVTGVPLDTFDQQSDLPMGPADDIDESTLPREFDARKAWPRCKSIGEVVHQGKCGSWYLNFFSPSFLSILINKLLQGVFFFL